MATATTETRRPETLAEASEAVAAGGVVRFVGGRTKLDWGNPCSNLDALVDTTGLGRIVTHNAADATIKVQAGMRLADLQTELASAGQWVALDAVGGADATIGGIFATDDSGPQRLAFGTLRDAVIGVTIVLADGTAARSGGFVIKNVAGYDLGRLLCGSFGTLGLVVDVNLRLHHRPEATATIRLPCDPAEATQAWLAFSRRALEPVGLSYTDDALWVRFAGRAPAVDGQVRRAREAMTADNELISDDADAWERIVAAMTGEIGQTVVRVGTLPAHLESAFTAAHDTATNLGIALSMSSQVATGAHTFRVLDGEPSEHAAFVRQLRQRLAALPGVPGHVVVRRRMNGLDVDAWGPATAAVDLMRSVKAQLDPDDRLAPGTFVGGI